MVPNFMSVNGDMKPLDYFSEDELDEIALEWGKNLKLRRLQQMDYCFIQILSLIKKINTVFN